MSRKATVPKITFPELGNASRNGVPIKREVGMSADSLQNLVFLIQLKGKKSNFKVFTFFSPFIDAPLSSSPSHQRFYSVSASLISPQNGILDQQSQRNLVPFHTRKS